MTSKSGLRKGFLNKRDSLARQIVIDKSDRIFKKLVKLGRLKSAKNFLAYLPINNEVDTKQLIDQLTVRQVAVFVPAFFETPSKYKVVKFTGYDDLEEGP